MTVNYVCFILEFASKLVVYASRNQVMSCQLACLMCGQLNELIFSEVNETISRSRKVLLVL